MSKKPQIITFDEPSVRSFTEWTPPMVRQALALTFNGHWSQAGLLIDAMLGYGRIQSVLGVRSRALQALDVEFEGAGKTILKHLENDLWNFFPEDTLQEMQTYGWCAGAVLVELEWTSTDGRWIPVIKTWHPSLQRYDTLQKQWYVRQQSGVEVPVTPGDGKWAVFSPGGRRRPWTGALARPLAIPFVAAHYSVSDWGGYNELHGRPMRVGVGASSAPERDAMADDLSGLAGDTAIALPPGYDVKLLEATARTWTSFKDQIDWANFEIAITILGQNTTTEVQSGSLAAAKVHDQVRGDILEADAAYMSTWLHQNILPRYIEFNFGNSPVPWVYWDATPPSDEKTEAEAQKTKAEAMGALADAVTKLRAAGMNPDVDALLEQAGIPVTQPATDPATPEQEAPVKSRSTGRLMALMGTELSPVARGQLYTDHLIGQALKAAGEDTVLAVLSALEETSDFGDFQTRLGMIAASARPGEHAEILEAAQLAAHLAGRLAVIEDA
ncbi:phage portal protein family protein [Deinococcus cellulosilyticus]|uniref:Portal protein n=1 Tax=Deinococcus cellulosilyticus (strain DSM 18568 / NBRC 106333 / KACC 11606 / 5516J-15) TaxID=1223518 RepID=A0A511NBP6_DEIC1|nr:DUF935 family protein [Deinococcus cellulosilyticus]GEM50017.1 hypothetical protein DC3_56520 [Deinococcus cellulosilyticus NBRC 106333 = KACC 11606]